MSASRFDAIIVGGGVYGCFLALEFLRARKGKRVLLVEKEATLLSRASMKNQARVHSGYHYPRSLLTALRCRKDYALFASSFSGAVRNSGSSFYAIARSQSNVTKAQFENFCKRIEAPLRPADPEICRLFESSLVETIFEVDEMVFDVTALREMLFSSLKEWGVEILLSHEVLSVSDGANALNVHVRDNSTEKLEEMEGKYVFNCTYAGLNELLVNSSIPAIPLKYELAEIALVEVPSIIASASITLMCGPFFSLLPFPSRSGPSLAISSLAHVRYTPHYAWDQTKPGVDRSYMEGARSNFSRIQADASRYLPVLANAKHIESMWEVKALLPTSEIDDSRPILIHRGKGRFQNLISILGAKIDTIFDLKPFIEGLD